MSKVYLAISEKEEETIRLCKYLKKKNPDYEFIYIDPNTATAEIPNILVTPFELLITPVSYIDMSTIQSLQIDGHICILDPSVTETTQIHEKVYIYEQSQFYIQFITKGLENTSVKKATSTKIEKSTSTHSQEKNIDIRADDTGTKPNEILSKKAQTSQKDHKKELLTASLSVQFEEPNNCKPVNLESYPPDIAAAMVKDLKRLDEITDEIIRVNYNYDKKKQNNLIGIWSPISLNGVTTFIINFAIYLANYNRDITVLEAITKTPTLKDKLSQYGSLPDNWISFFRTLYSKGFNVNNLRWTFRDVDWHPINTDDLKDFEWTYDVISRYLKLVKRADFSFLDLPHGKMEPSTLHTLEHLEQLWIMVDNTSSLSWLPQIKEISLKYDLPVYVIVTKCYSKKVAKKIANQLELPLLAVFPSLEKEYQLYDKHDKPLIDYLSFRKKITPSYEEIAAHLLGKEFEKYKPTILKKIKRILAKVDSE